MIINEVSGVIQNELGPKEQLLWAGVPRKGFALRKSDTTLIPFSIMWGGFAIFWEFNVVRTGELFMILWGIPFVVIGLYMMIGRFFTDTWQRNRTYYGVTNERAIIVTQGLFGKQVKSLNLANLYEMTVDEQINGSGTITFGLPQPTAVKETHRSFRLSSPSQGTSNENSEQRYPAFEMITDVKTVNNLIRQAQQSIVR